MSSIFILSLFSFLLMSYLIYFKQFEDNMYDKFNMASIHFHLMLNLNYIQTMDYINNYL